MLGLKSWATTARLTCRFYVFFTSLPIVLKYIYFMCMHMRLWVYSSIAFFLLSETKFLTELGAHQFSYSGWPGSSRYLTSFTSLRLLLTYQSHPPHLCVFIFPFLCCDIPVKVRGQLTGVISILSSPVFCVYQSGKH